MFEIRRYYNYARVVLYDSFEKTIVFQRFRFTVKGGMFEWKWCGVMNEHVTPHVVAHRSIRM